VTGTKLRGKTPVFGLFNGAIWSLSPNFRIT
jgi:hypothetical protein